MLRVDIRTVLPNKSSLICELVCDAGFESNVHKSECLPKCEGGCVNGNCVSPKNCTCHEVFELNELKQCMPTCDEECVNADCKYTNVCACWTGFSQVNSTHCEIPCENCNHGYCLVANVCECDIGYHNEDGRCVENECTPNIMEDTCENGYCSANGICMCHSGYEKNSSMTCAPICSLECINGFRSEPEVCNCFDGYINHPRNQGKCILPEELIQMNLMSSTSMPTYFWVILVMVSLGIIITAAAGFVYWRYVRENSYVCNSEVIYRKDDDINVL